MSLELSRCSSLTVGRQATSLKKGTKSKWDIISDAEYSKRSFLFVFFRLPLRRCPLPREQGLIASPVHLT